jgi:hypothetical protein
MSIVPLRLVLARTGLLPIARTLRQHTHPYARFYLQNLLRALRPRTFSDKVRRKMLFDRRDLLPLTADKAAVRDYVTDMVGERYLKRAYAITDDPTTIDWAALPREFVCKATHASGGVLLVTDDAEADARVEPFERVRWRRMAVRPGTVAASDLIAVCSGWLRRRYGWGWNSTHEWHYLRIPPRILVEELLRGHGGTAPVEHRFFVFEGRCDLIQVVIHDGARRFAAHFRPAWTPVDVKHRRLEPPPGEVERPPTLPEMISVAERLGSETDFVRVDLLAAGDRIAFGEMTHFPNAGKPSFPPAADAVIGASWRRVSYRSLRPTARGG